MAAVAVAAVVAVAAAGTMWPWSTRTGRWGRWATLRVRREPLLVRPRRCRRCGCTLPWPGRALALACRLHGHILRP